MIFFGLRVTWSGSFWVTVEGLFIEIWPFFDSIWLSRKLGAIDAVVKIRLFPGECWWYIIVWPDDYRVQWLIWLGKTHVGVAFQSLRKPPKTWKYVTFLHCEWDMMQVHNTRPNWGFRPRIPSATAAVYGDSGVFRQFFVPKELSSCFEVNHRLPETGDKIACVRDPGVWSVNISAKKAFDLNLMPGASRSWIWWICEVKSWRNQKQLR